MFTTNSKVTVTIVLFKSVKNRGGYL